MIEGWELKEARLKLDHSIDHRGRPPRWEGQPLHNKSLLITAEEGIGMKYFLRVALMMLSEPQNSVL